MTFYTIIMLKLTRFRKRLYINWKDGGRSNCTVNPQVLYSINIITVEPVLSGTVLSGHPLLSGHVAKSRKFHNINAI